MYLFVDHRVPAATLAMDGLLERCERHVVWRTGRLNRGASRGRVDGLHRVYAGDIGQGLPHLVRTTRTGHAVNAQLTLNERCRIS